MLEIIRAKPVDRSILREIAIESKGYWGYKTFLMEEFAKAPIITRESIEHDPVFKAMRDGATAGWYRVFPHVPVAEIEDLWVLPAEIGTGIGRALFQHACKIAREAGCSAAAWDADPNAVGFYEKMGAVVIGQSWSEWQRYLPRLRIEL